MKKVLMDFDGVYYDLMSSIKHQLKKDGYNFVIENIKTYDFQGDIGCPQDVVLKQLKNPEVFGSSKPYLGATQSLEKLKKVVEVHAYTSSGSSNEVAKTKDKQIKELGICGKAIVGKKSLVEDNEVVAIFDDNVEVLKTWMDKPSVMFFLIKQPYNVSINSKLLKRPNLFLCDSFSDAVDKFLNMIGNENIVY